MMSPLFLFMVTLQVAANVTGSSTDQALSGIKNAELSGADVSGLVDEFNVAISLQEQAAAGQFRSCSSIDDCVKQANDMLLSIADDASSLKSQAAAEKEQESLIIFTVYVPISSFVASVAIVAAYRTWKSWRTKRFENLNIRDKRPS